MAKYMALFSSSTSASDLMKNATPEQMKESMNEWIQWHENANKTVKVEFGLPLQAVGRITPGGFEDSDNTASGYATMEGDSKDEMLELLKSHPHLKREGASIDLLEMLSMPGL
jgi:hypothetical protein